MYCSHGLFAYQSMHAVDWRAYYSGCLAFHCFLISLSQASIFSIIFSFLLFSKVYNLVQLIMINKLCPMEEERVVSAVKR